MGFLDRVLGNERVIRPREGVSFEKVEERAVLRNFVRDVDLSERRDLERFFIKKILHTDVIYEPFIPETELRQILSRRGVEEPYGSKEERLLYRKQALSEFKERLRQQKEGIMEIVKRLREMVLDEGVTDIKKLEDVVKQGAPAARLTHRQIIDFYNVIELIGKRFKTLALYRSQYPTPRDLFHACFGVEPTGEVDVIHGSLTLHFQCFTAEDYVVAYSAGSGITADQIAGQGDQASSDVNDKMIRSLRQAALRSGGAALGTVSSDRSLDDLITIERIPEGGLGADRCVFEHEEQHQIDALFEPVREELLNEEVLGLAVERSEDKTLSEQMLIKKLVRDLIRVEKSMTSMEEGARTEILSYYRDGTPLHDIFQKLRFSKLYDYQSSLRISLREIADEVHDVVRHSLYLSKRKIKDGTEKAALPITLNDKMVWKMVQEVFYAEYYEDIAEWLQAIERLTTRGYSKEEILSLLATEHPRQWSMVSKRMPDQTGG